MRVLVLATLLGIAFARSADPSPDVEITNPGSYYWFPSPLPDVTCTIKFQVKATRDAVITFSPQKSLVSNIYQTILGAENNQFVCIVRKQGTRPIVDRSWPGILIDEWQTFWVEYCNGVVTVEGEVRGRRLTLATYTDNDPLNGNKWYVGVTSLGAISEWRILSSESCGITDQRDNDQPEEDNRVPTDNNSDDDDEPNRGDRGRGGSSISSSNGGRQRGSSDSSDEPNRGGDGRRGSATSRSNGGRQRGSSDSSDEPNRGGDGRRGSSNSRSNGGRQRGSSDSSDEPNRGGDGRRGSSNSRSNGGRQRGSSDSSDEPNRGGDGRRGSSNSRSNGGRQRGSSDSSDEPNRGGDGRRGSSNSRSNGGLQRGSSDNSDEPNRGGDGRRGSSNSGTGRRGTSTSGTGRRRSSSNRRTPDRDNQGRSSDKFQIDIRRGNPVDGTAEWRFIEKEIASPGNFRIPFWVKSGGDSYIRLASQPGSNKGYYDIMLGFRGNTFLCILRERTNVDDNRLPGLLNADDFVDFVLSYDGRTVKVEKGGEVLASYRDNRAFKNIRYVGITSYVGDKTTESWWRFNKSSFKQGRDEGPKRSRSSKRSSKKSSKKSSKSKSSKSSKKSRKNRRRGSSS